jgi:hypothetical protein
MEKHKAQLLTIFLIVFLLTITIAPAGAVTLSFVDGAYLKANDYTITDQSGTTIANFTGSSTITLISGKSYSVDFKPNGLFDFSKDRPGEFTSLGLTFDFFHQYLAGLIVLAGMIGLIVTYKGR